MTPAERTKRTKTGDKISKLFDEAHTQVLDLFKEKEMTTRGKRRTYKILAELEGEVLREVEQLDDKI